MNGGCAKCRSGQSKLHRSEFDLLYGSRLSTRVQDTAKSAWRSTKKLAVSVISSSVSITACKHGGQGKWPKVGGGKTTRKVNGKSKKNDDGGAPQWATIPVVEQLTCNEDDKVDDVNKNYQLQEKEAEGNCLSIIKVEASCSGLNSSSSSSPLSSSNNNNNNNKSELENVNVNGERVFECPIMNDKGEDVIKRIHKDQNNKLTIVNKFSSCSINENSNVNVNVNENENNNSKCISAASSTSGCCESNERTRCESSTSSGRGSSEDGNSQNEDQSLEKVENLNQNNKMVLSSSNADDSAKRHKRRPSQVLSSKIKSLFVSRSSMVVNCKPISASLSDQDQSEKVDSDEMIKMKQVDFGQGDEISTNKSEAITRSTYINGDDHEPRVKVTQLSNE